MEMELVFDEAEFIRIYANSYSKIFESQKGKINKWKKHIYASCLLILLFSLLAIYKLDWLIFTTLSLIYGLSYGIDIFKLLKEDKRSIRQHKKEVMLMLKRLSGLNQVLYRFDDTDIEYYEDGECIIKTKWETLTFSIIDDDYVILYLGEKTRDSNLFVPKKMANEQVYLDFLALVKSQLKADAILVLNKQNKQ